MSEWYVYLGWVLAIISITMMIAIMLVRKPPYEYDSKEAVKYTIAFSYNNKIYLTPVFMNNPNNAEYVLQLYEQASNPECMPDMQIYQYDLVGVIKGHVKWINNLEE